MEANLPLNVKTRSSAYINNLYYAGRLFSFFIAVPLVTRAEKTAAALRHMMSPVQQGSVLFSLALRNPSVRRQTCQVYVKLRMFLLCAHNNAGTYTHLDYL